MKTHPAIKTSPDMAEKVRLARRRLTNAENKLATAREEARLARQHRKAAKQAARQAKKQVRLAKERVRRADVALVRLEARLALLGRRPVKAKISQPAAANTAAAPRRNRPARTAAVRRRRFLKIDKPARERTAAKTAMSPISDAAKIPDPVSPELETPVEVLPPSEQKPTQQIVKDVEAIFIEETDAPESRVPAVETIALPVPPAKPLTINLQETL